MSSKKTGRSAATASTSTTANTTRADVERRGSTQSATPLPVRVAGYAVAAAILAAAFAVDPAAAAAFDAPKWLLVQLAALVGAGCLIGWRGAAGDWRLDAWRQWSRVQQAAVALLGATLALGLMSAYQSSHQPSAWNSLLEICVVALFLVLGASRVVERPLGTRLLYVVLGAGVLTAVLSLMQAAGMTLPIETVQLGGRYPTGALLGNEGYVALFAALVAVAALALLLTSKFSSHVRLQLAGVVLLAIAAIAVNQQATSAAALSFAVVLMACVRWRQRWITGALLIAVALVVASASVPVLRSATWGAVPGMDGDRWQRLTTYRLGGWTAAEEMVRMSPWLGRGPGSFAEESTIRRFDAEMHWQQRFLQPTGATFVYAHQEWLQLAAEWGLPALLCAVLAFVMIFVQVLHRALSNPLAAEPMLLLGLLAAGVIMSLAWFPMQIPVTAIILLLALGRSWRLLATPGAEQETRT